MSDLAILLLIIFLGYILGRIKIGGIQLGSSGILLVALFFGHFGYDMPKIIGDFGLILFLGSVGYTSGPVFVKNFKSNGFTFITIATIVIILGFSMMYLFITRFSLPTPLALGLLAGGLTSTPALGAGIEATGGSELVTVGYGIAYVFGVVGVIIFVQIMPKLAKKDLPDDATPDIVLTEQNKVKFNKVFKIDRNNLAMFSLSMLLGVLLGSIKVPLRNGLTFSLGISGGPLLAGILFGSRDCIGRIALNVDKSLLSNLRELGLILFLARSGLASGNGFLNVLYEYGYVLFVYGALITIVPMILGYIIARILLKKNIKVILGSLTGAMTSTPALGTLMEVFDNDVSLGAAYAATYPMALILLVIMPQILVMFV